MCCEFVIIFIWADDGQRFYCLLSRDSDGSKEDWEIVLALFAGFTQHTGHRC
jgi:hypothetical protein